MIQSPISEFIATLKDTGYTLRVEDGRLKVIHPSRPLTDEEREFIREHKPDIVHALSRESPGPDDTPADTPGGPGLDAWRREYIAREQEGWTPERRQAQADEIQRIEEYRRQRGPRPSGPPAGSIPRAEVFQLIGSAMERLGAIWPGGLDTDPQWQDRINTAAQSGNREKFLAEIREWEASETRRVNEYMDGIRREVAAWPDTFRERFSIMIQGFMNKDRGLGITVRGLNANQAAEKAYRDLLPHIPAKEPDTPPTPATDQADGFPFTDMHPHTREILLRHWRGWDAARRARFIEEVRDVMRRTGYSEGNACAFCLQTAGPVAPGRPPALSPEEKEALHKRMWPTPPGKQEPKSTVPGPDIAKLVSKWPKNLRLEFAGRVGKYSNEMPINQAMSRAYNELKPDVEKNMP